MLTKHVFDIPDLPSPLPVSYMYTEFTPPEKVYFGNKSLSREPLYVLDADVWRMDNRPYHFEVEWRLDTEEA